MTTAKAALLGLAVLAAGWGAFLLLTPERTSERREVTAEKPLPDDAYRATGAGNALSSVPTADSPLWEAVDERAVDPLPEYSTMWSTEGRVLVRVSMAINLAGGWRVGDRLTVPLPQLGVVYRPLIEQIDDGPGPSRSVLGKVRGEDGRRHLFVVTTGPMHVFAYIDSPRGSYELVGGNEFGWLVPTSSMKTGFNYSEPDYILPDGSPDPNGP